MNDVSDLLIRISLATCPELSSLKEEAEEYISSTPALIPFFIDWWGRELNRQSLLKCGSQLYSHNGDLKPSAPGDYLPILLLEDNFEFLLEDGSRIMLE